MLNIQIQHKFKYAQQQILFFKRLFNVKLVYSIQVLGPWLWGNRPFFFFIGGAEEGAQWGKCPTTPYGINKCLGAKGLTQYKNAIWCPNFKTPGVSAYK